MLRSGAIHPLDTGNYLMIEESMYSLKSSFKIGITLRAPVILVEKGFG